MKPIFIAIVSASASFSALAAEVTEIKIKSSLNGTEQKALYWAAPESAKKAAPLLVWLHSWSGNYKQKNGCLAECEKRGWSLILPDFRGPNWTPQACASELAVRDVLDAVEWMKKNTKVDTERVYLAGSSGGGHMSLVMAGRAPELWAGVSAWVPISDLAAWHRECTESGRRYADNMVKVCGGAPGKSKTVDEEYRNRSPQTWLTKATGVNLDINAGIHDGHTGSVPVTHSLHAFNVLAEANGEGAKKLTAVQLKFFRTKRKAPAALRFKGTGDSNRKHEVLFRRSSGNARVTVFEGGHEADLGAAIRWLEEQRK